MALFFIFLSFILFFYLLSRLNSLEKMVGEIAKGKTFPPQYKQTSENKTEDVLESTNLSQAEPMVQNIQPEISESSLASYGKEEQSHAEFAVGSKVLTGVGIFALLLGIGFFLRYAFQNDLISESLRVILGIVFGLIVASIGHLLRKKYSSYGYTLVGGGLGILYLSIYSAYSFYNLISVPAAFLSLLVVTGLGVGGSLLYNSKPLISYSFVGAFIIPFILPIALSVHVLFVYLLIINLGVLLIARFKVWPELTIGSLIGTGLIYLKWVYGPYNDSLFEITIAYSTLIFFIYFLTSLLNFVWRDREYNGIDGFLLYSIPIVYFLLNLSIVTGKENISIFALLIGFYYIIISLILRAGFSSVGELKKYSNAMLFIATPFIAGATALHFEGETLTIVWAVEAIAIILVGNLLKTPSNRIAGIILSAITGIKMIFFDLGKPLSDTVIFNSRGGVAVMVSIMFVVLLWVYVRNGSEQIEGDEKEAGKYVGSIGVFLSLFLWITFESRDFISDYLLYLPIIWIVFSVIIISSSFIVREKTLRFLAYASAFLAIIFAFVFHSSIDLLKYGSFLNIRVITVFVIAAFVFFLSIVFKNNKDQLSEDEFNIKNVFLALVNILALWMFSLEILGYYDIKGRNVIGQSFENIQRVALSGFWLLYALVSMGIGIFRRSLFVRYFSIILLAITIFKIFIYDTANLNDVYRFISFILLGVILLITGFAYYKFKDRITEFVR